MSTSSPEEAKIRATEIAGYAIISDDNKIAGPDGLLPPSMRNEKDWEYYQRALAGSDLIVFGRRSHELEPNVRGDKRLVVSSDAAGLDERANAWWWNPARVSWAKVAKRLLPFGGAVAVPGGQRVFDLFLQIGFDAFHLSHAHGVTLPGGRVDFFRLRQGALGRDRALHGRLACQRKDRARSGSGRRNERLARGPRGARRLRPDLVADPYAFPSTRGGAISSTMAGAAARSENRTQSGSNARKSVWGSLSNWRALGWTA